ncbi:FAD-dependent oxidoreductase [Pareuzebyella sediminis]|uniref:FAD-dependent oxidoreductase n=1 Tax=Pareuzebyella sediminis TaxID=2607998 RepID=UPI0011EF5812|nr:GMC family oxidoreductase [Pareuzebyella sediminis]
MHIDARKLEDDSIIEGDVCIIGAGTAGISIALEWIDSKKKVILLEGGGFEYDKDVQSLYSGETTGQKYYPLQSTRLHYFGGTTGHWAGMCSPYDPIDFQERDWVPHSGWPISREALDPFYSRAHRTLELGPYNYDFESWKAKIPGLIPFPVDENVVWNKLWQFSEARFNSLYAETIINSKSVHLYTYANVVDILGNENLTKIHEVVAKNHSGKTCKIRAKQFILACGAIQNARLLLASRTQTSQGLGNDNDLVGRYFMEHLEHASAELWLFKPFPTKLYTWSSDTEVRAELAITEKSQRENQILNGTVSLFPLTLGRSLKSEMDLWNNEDPRKSAENFWNDIADARAAAEKITEGSISRAFTLHTRIEQAPNPNSRVTLLSEKDELGVPKTKLNWELTALDKRSIRRIYQLLGRQMGLSNLGRVRLNEFLRDEDDTAWPDDLNAGWHHMGTTRMSDTPKKGVVDPNCQVHGISNLYVAGSGCYTTSGAPNPTLTLVALSLRLSDYIKEKV